MKILYRGYRIVAERRTPQLVRYAITNLHTGTLLDGGLEDDLTIWDVMARCRGRVDLEKEGIGEDD